MDPNQIATFVIALAAAIQAVSAAFVAILTRRLASSTEQSVATAKQLAQTTAEYTAITERQADLTDRLVKLTEQYTETTSRQLQEMEKARLSGIQPHVHVTKQLDTEIPQNSGAHLTLYQTGTGGPGIELTLALKNVGPGAALGVRLYLRHPDFQFEPSLEATDLAPQETGPFLIKSRIASIPAASFSPTKMHSRLWIEYRDLVGRLWRTMTPARFDLQDPGTGSYMPQRVFVVDAEERVREVREHYIRQHDTVAGLFHLGATDADEDPDRETDQQGNQNG